MENQLTHTIIKLAVENGIRYIQDNPKRGVRNLLDLGEYFASGRFQKSFFELVHQMLTNENSRYYIIIENLVKNINHETLTNIGINIGYNSFTYGANIIRENENKYGINIPWLLTFDFKEIKNDHLTADEISHIIKCGKGFGIYSYMFFIEKNDILMDLYPVMVNNDDSAFIIVISPSIINEEFTKKISNIHNLCLLVSIDDINKSDRNNISLLRKYKCLFGGCFYYDNSNYINVINDRIPSKVLSIDSNLLIMIRKPNCSEKIIKNTYDYIYKSRFNLNNPVFMMDFYGDIKLINEIISDKSCFLAIDNVGQICNYNLENKTKYNIHTSSLKDIFKVEN